MAFTYKTTSYETGKRVDTVVTAGEGSTLAIGYKIVQVMSDIWEEALSATYIDEKGRIVTHNWIEAGGTVDATDEAIERARQYLFHDILKLKIEQAQAEARRIVRESTVKVVSGRTAKGTVGKVAVIIERPYNVGYRSHMEKKLGIATSDEKVQVAAANGKVYENYKDMVWVWARNCEIVNVPEIDMETCREEAANGAERALSHYRR